MNKKLKNLNTLDLIFTLLALSPFIFLLMYYFFYGMCNNGVQQQTQDLTNIFLEPLRDFSKIEILGLNNLNDWLVSNIIKIPTGTNELVSCIITFSLFTLEYYVFLYLVKIILKLLTYILKVCDNAF
jgi:hypothetical protein